MAEHEKQKFTVQFSADGTMYYVREMVFKHVWLGVDAHPEIPETPRLLMPFSGVCAYEHSGVRYFRIFFNQSYIGVLLGESEEREADDELVRDYAAAAAFVPTEEVKPPPAPRKRSRGKRGKN